MDNRIILSTIDKQLTEEEKNKLKQLSIEKTEEPKKEVLK